jgi:SAM-dependent methyltransferase
MIAPVAERTPIPPLELAHRVGSVEHAEDPLELYEMLGRETRDQILSMLPGDWSMEGKRVLDFGCGAGRTLRHFLSDASQAEFWGCDIDTPSVDWLKQNLSPPLHVFRNPPQPPISRPNGYFDLVYAISVFTHLTDTWSEWLLDLHRVLGEGGLLITTYMGEGMSEQIAGEPWQEDRVGMNVLRAWQSWDQGGPSVLHSDWWIRAHWSRAFEILEVQHRPQMGGELGRHAWVLMRRLPGEPTPDELERLEPDEPREIEALRHNIRQLQAEGRSFHDAAEEQLDAQRRHASEELGIVRDGYEESASWRITKPLRIAKHLRQRGRD